jgi:Predicted pPIWI-associating nuclease
MSIEQEYFSHLLALKRVETALTLGRQGYEALVDTKVSGQDVDLVATKDGKTLLYEFKLAADLRHHAGQILRLRALAAEKGYVFKLVVVAPPKRTMVEVKGLESALSSFLTHGALPNELDSLASAVFIEDVSDVDISEIEVGKDEIVVAGNGIVGVRLEYGGGEENDGVSSEDAFPFSFRVTLNRDLEVVTAEDVEVDTASFYE